jgi:DNA-binding GntR family transcriptional regulator
MPVPEQQKAVARHLLRDDAYLALRDAMVSGLLAPGEHLHDSELCAWLNLSRTPVRDALARLEDEGLVETAPQRYTRVAPLEQRDALDAFPVLAALHALATELAVPRLQREDIERLHAANAEFVEAIAARDPERAYAADERLHGVFITASGNADIGRLLARLTPRVHRLERLRARTPPGRRSAAQHQAIIARAASGDAARAASATRENWLEFGALVARSLAAPSPRI